VEVGIVVTGSDDGAGVGAVGSLVGVGAVVSGVDWAAGSWVTGGALGVSRWLHPHNDKPASALAATIWISRNDFIFVIPFFKPTFPI
jgi:hypothetical protein